ncbi:hypothetical protein C4D60_Mb02t07370 [Musa balbisiana]|uniref:Uncharacterized protein n=1 Tax=Musa balbisiana TaxID=52838 RepID=A0A4S8I8Y3_MUSBA|nr:hypothetical protein C4D60_Mb02t07370 [Musa balbisiana]
MGAVFGSNDGGDLVFCAIIIWLSVIAMTIFSSVDHPSEQSKKRSGLSRLVLLQEKGGRCACCIGGAGVCGTYLS